MQDTSRVEYHHRYAASGYPDQYYHQQHQTVMSNANYRPKDNPPTVIVQQPGPGMAYPLARDWNSGVCGCMEDCKICLCGMFCGLCLAMTTSRDMNESCFAPCCVPGATISLRMKMRLQQNIAGSLMDDCIMDTFCGPCALCQLAREVKHCQETGTMARL